MKREKATGIYEKVPMDGGKGVFISIVIRLFIGPG